MKTSEFNLQNVKCAGCVGKIQSALAKLPSVKLAQVNLLDKTLHVEYLAEAEDNQVIETVEKLGFGASKDLIAEQKINLWLSVGLPFIIGGLLMSIGMMHQFMLDLTTTSGMSLGLIYALISLIVVVATGHKIIKSGYIGFKTLNFNMHSLILLGVGSAWLYSFLIIIWCYFSHSLAVQHLYFDSSLMIIGLINLGAYFEERAKNNTTAAIKALTKLVPQETIILVDGVEQKIATNLLRTDMLVKIRPGEQLPADGVVVSGDGYLNESMLTGESLPVHKKIGDKVISGSINNSGSLIYSVSAVGGNTLLAEIIQLVKSAQLSKPQLAKLADQVAKIFVPTIMLIALISALIWFFAVGNNNWFHALTAFMTVLIIACPCSVGLAIPVALMVGIGRGATKGILIREGSCLSVVDKLTTILLDKTGTITQGVPQVIALDYAVKADREGVLYVLKSLEIYSEHPLAQAIMNHSPTNILATVDNFQSWSGQGVSGVVDGVKYYAGSALWMKEICQDNQSELLQNNNYSQIYLATKEKILLRVDIADAVKVDSAAAITELTKQGYQIAMVSGDNKSTAETIAAQVGISEVYAECKPQDKAALIQKFQAQGKVVAFVGDGINDAPSLALANIGIAMGGGSDIALQSASISLMRNSLFGVVDALNLAHKINQNMRQNLFGSFIYNALAVLVAAGVLYPIWGIMLNPVIASVVMSLSSITVISNALRLRNA